MPIGIRLPFAGSCAFFGFSRRPGRIPIKKFSRRKPFRLLQITFNSLAGSSIMPIP